MTRLRLVLLFVLVAGLGMLATPAQAVSSPRLGVIGDSLTYQGGRGAGKITAKLAADGWDTANVRVDGHTGRTIAADSATGYPGTITTIRNWRAAGFDPDVYVLALGTNNKNASVSYWTSAINKVLAEIGPHPVYWISLGFRTAGDSRAEAFTSTLRTIAANHANLRVAAWDGYVHSFDQTGLWLSTDTEGVHMTTAGYSVRNDYYVQSVRPARMFQ